MISRGRWLPICIVMAGVLCLLVLIPARQRLRLVTPDSVARSSKQPTWTSDSLRINSWRYVEDFDDRLAVFETVFWDRSDTESLRALIRNSDLFKGKTVLEIGTGSGLISLCCAQAGAEKVVATDINPSAVANAAYNASALGLKERIEVRHVSEEDPSAFAVILPDERFDVIVSNPPWVSRKPASIDEYALYDRDFVLLRSLFDGLRDRLKPGGRLLLAYGCVDAIRTVQQLAADYQFECLVRDERNLDEQTEEFLPGMLLEIR